MKIAVLADIHGNHIALKRCLEYIAGEEIDAVFLLGDYIGELAYPQKTMKILYESVQNYKCYFIKGNKEDYWIYGQGMDRPEFQQYASTTGMLRYAYQNLTQKDIRFFSEMPASQDIYMENMPGITICHGSPRKTNEMLLPEGEHNAEILNGVDTKYIIGGHSHRQAAFCECAKTIWNPGSVGVPLGSGGKLQFAILHGDESAWNAELISLPYDVDQVISEMREERLFEIAPFWSKVTERLLREGNISHGSVLARAMELCRQETGECMWPAVPEKYWEMAYGEMFY